MANTNAPAKPAVSVPKAPTSVVNTVVPAIKNVVVGIGKVVGSIAKTVGTVVKTVVVNVAKNVVDAVPGILNTVKGGTLFVAGTSYQIVDSALFNVASNASKIMGSDINKINSLPFQLGRQTGNSTVQYMSVLAITGGGGAAAAGAMVAVTGTGICAASLAGGGIILVPCAISISAASTLAAAGALTASYGGVLYSVTNKNQSSIADAVPTSAISATFLLNPSLLHSRELSQIVFG